MVHSHAVNTVTLFLVMPVESNQAANSAAILFEGPESGSVFFNRSRDGDIVAEVEFEQLGTYHFRLVTPMGWFSMWPTRPYSVEV